MLKKIGIAASAGVLGLSMLAGASTLVSAQSSDSTDGINFFERLATKLGITEEKLTEAGKEVQYEIIDEKVASGELDSEKAEEIKSRIEESEESFGMFGHVMGGPGHKFMMKFGKDSEFLSGFLGATQEEIEALQEQDLTMEEILEKYGKTKEELHTYMEENRPLPPFLGDFLGITDEEVQTLQDEKLSMAEVLEKYGKTEEELKTYMEENRPERGDRFIMRFDDGQMQVEDDVTVN